MIVFVPLTFQKMHLASAVVVACVVALIVREEAAAAEEAQLVSKDENPVKATMEGNTDRVERRSNHKENSEGEKRSSYHQVMPKYVSDTGGKRNEKPLEDTNSKSSPYADKMEAELLDEGEKRSRDNPP